MFSIEIRRVMMRALFCTATALIAFVYSNNPIMAASKSKLRSELLDITKEPNTKDWKRFIKQPEKARKKMWNYFEARGENLGSWSWGWRIGWVRTCTFSKARFCGEILKSALFDDAVVVRSEAAVRIGKRYEDSKNATVINLLTKAYANKRNIRRGKPLFVQNRILYALRQVGGDSAIATATKLAKSHPQSQSYWSRLHGQ